MPRGGARANSGGKREGAGRKAAPKQPIHTTPPPMGSDGALSDNEEALKEDALAYLLRVVADVGEDPKLRVRAAVAAVQYQHIKKGDGGKKEERADASKKAATGKFKPAAPPKLVVNNR